MYRYKLRKTSLVLLSEALVAPPIFNIVANQLRGVPFGRERSTAHSECLDPEAFDRPVATVVLLREERDEEEDEEEDGRDDKYDGDDDGDDEGYSE